MSLGGMTGQLLAGLLGPRLGWRAPFVPVGGLVVVEAEYLKVRTFVLQPGLERTDSREALNTLHDTAVPPRGWRIRHT